MNHPTDQHNLKRDNKKKFLTILLLFYIRFLFGQSFWETESFYYVPNGSERQQINVYYPTFDKRTSRNSCAVYLPGGGWSSHIPNWNTNIPAIARQLLNSGFVIFYIDFRPTGPGSYWPAQAEDWEAAMAFIVKKEHTEYFGINPEIISGWGHSAGGHAIHYLREKGWLKIAVSWAAPTDLTKLPELWPRLFGNRNTEEEYFQKAISASPVFFVNLLPDKSTFSFMIHGNEDQVIPIEQSELMFIRLLENEQNVYFTEILNGDHSFNPYMDGKEVNYTYEEIEKMSASFISESVYQLKQAQVSSAIITKVERVVNQSFLLTEFCNHICFRNNPNNIENKLDITEYKLYRKIDNEGNYSFITNLPTATSKFLDRGLEKDLYNKYIYYITCLANLDGELIESKIE